MKPEESFCGVNLIKLGEYYSNNISGYADVSLCLIGSLLNSFNLTVFTRKHMISPANLIFTHLAFVDLMVLLTDIPVSWRENIEKYDNSADKKWSYQWIIIEICCNYFSVTLHCVSVCLTVMLAIWRYLAIEYPLKEEQWCNMEKTRIVIIIGYATCVLFNVPMYFLLGIETETSDLNLNFFYKPKFKRDSLLYPIVFVVNGLLFRLLPSILLSMFSFQLIVALISTKNERKRLISPFNRPNEIEQGIDRSTSMLLMMLALFLIAEVPIGILSLSKAIYSSTNDECYDILGQIFDTVAIFNASVTFLIHYIMSQQFRTTFKSLFSRNPPFQKYSIMRVFSRNMSTETDTRQDE